MYNTIRNLLFNFDAEKVHYFSMDALKNFASTSLGKSQLRKWFMPPANPVTVFGLTFQNRVGLAAGFDKNARFLTELELLGFGHVEIGTVTPLPQEGNAKPRLFRIPEDEAIINRMGFNNEGMQAIAARLAIWRARNKDSKLIIGGNIGKNKNTPNEAAASDYEKCFLALKDFVDYFVVNVSSPNTPGLRELQEKDSLRGIFTLLQKHNENLKKPLLLKIAPDLSPEQVEDVIDLALEMDLDGLVVSNTTISREALSSQGKEKAEKMGAGGLSGRPVFEKSTALLQYIHSKTNGRIPLIGSGGIFTRQEADDKIAAGASLVQVWTGFIYKGPGIVKAIA